MKKILIVSIIGCTLSLLAACMGIGTSEAGDNSTRRGTVLWQAQTELAYGNIGIQKVKDCEYVVVYHYDAVALAHYADCSNPAHDTFVSGGEKDLDISK